MSIENALTEMASILEAATTAKAYAEPPESLPRFPVYVLEWTGGEMTNAAAALTNDLLTAVVALYTNRQVLPTASAAARPFIEDTRDALWGNASLNGECLTIEAIRFDGPGGMDYNDNQFYGIRFEVDVRFKENVTFAL